MTILQIAALVYLFAYYGLLLGFRSYLLYKRTGINPIRRLEKNGLAGFVERVFGLCFFLVSFISLNYVFLEQNYHQYLVPIDYLVQPVLGNLGILFSFIGLFLAFIAQLQMGDNWRLGINQMQDTSLITKGLFQYSRNPVYLGILIANLGFFLMMPNACSLCWLALSYVALEIKIRLEEVSLEEQHAAQFVAYKLKVRRWW